MRELERTYACVERSALLALAPSCLCFHFVTPSKAPKDHPLITPITQIFRDKHGTKGVLQRICVIGAICGLDSRVSESARPLYIG
jgi:hypothetical protein